VQYLAGAAFLLRWDRRAGAGFLCKQRPGAALTVRPSRKFQTRIGTTGILPFSAYAPVSPQTNPLKKGCISQPC
jgi:hypothetical protein